MPRKKGTRANNTTSCRTDTPRMSERLRSATKTSSTTISRGGKNPSSRGGKTPSSHALSSAGAVRATQKRTKKSNATNSPPAKRQRLRERSPSISEDDESEVFDDAPITRADIPKIVEAVMNQFQQEGDDSQNQGQDDQHLGKYIIPMYAAPFASCDSASDAQVKG